MVMAGLWTPDWLLGLFFAFFLLMTISSTFVQSARRWAYDVGVGASDLLPSQCVAIIGIDDWRIATIGHWSWSRDVPSGAVELRARAEAASHLPFLFEQQRGSRPQYRNWLTEQSRSVPGGGHRSRACQGCCGTFSDKAGNHPFVARFSRCDCDSR